MRIDLINEKKIQIIISAEECINNGIDLDTLTYESPILRKIARSAIEDLSARDKSKLSPYALSSQFALEATVLRDSSLLLMVTLATEPDELDIRFSDFTPLVETRSKINPNDMLMGGSDLFKDSSLSKDSSSSKNLFSNRQGKLSAKSSLENSDSIAGLNRDDAENILKLLASMISNMSDDDVDSLNKASGSKSGFQAFPQADGQTKSEADAEPNSELNSEANSELSSESDSDNKSDDYFTTYDGKKVRPFHAPHINPDGSLSDEKKPKKTGKTKPSKQDLIPAGSNSVKETEPSSAKAASSFRPAANKEASLLGDKMQREHIPAQIFCFKSFDDACYACATCSSDFEGESSLHKDSKGSDYYLILKSRMTRKQFIRYCNSMFEYSYKKLDFKQQAAYIKEHCETIISADAVDKLKSL